MSGKNLFWNINLKKITPVNWLVIVMTGILLVIIALPTKKQASDSWGNLDVLEASEEVNASDMELRLESILSKVEGIENVQVMIATDDQERVSGVLVVARGADEPITIKKIQEAVMALFQIEAHKIKVMNMK